MTSTATSCQPTHVSPAPTIASADSQMPGSTQRYFRCPPSSISPMPLAPVSPAFHRTTSGRLALLVSVSLFVPPLAASVSHDTGPCTSWYNRWVSRPPSMSTTSASSVKRSPEAAAR
eukprot:143506-Prymnesium_polylepis.1